MVGRIEPFDLRRRMKSGEFQLVDVREDDEHGYCRIEGSIHIPMGRLIAGGEEDLDPNKPVVCYCHHGIRSHQCAEYLAFRGFGEVFNLQGGINAWSLQVDPSTPRY